ncbi:hypothetical protein EK21DRAFT_81678, partial [Setomelanomma holmii]
QDRAIPPIPQRSEHIDQQAIHGIRFEYYDEIAHNGLDDDQNPAIVHVPVFMFARNDGSIRTYYPEGATNAKGNGPNPGTDVPYTLLSREVIPVYTSAVNGADEWRLDFAVYYVHDGNLGAGHHHDWEGVSIVFKRV